MKKPVVVLGIVAVLNASLMWGCGGRSPSSPQSESVLDRETQSQMAAAERREYWIGRMDPFVTQAESGEYVFDESGFTAAIDSLSDADRMVIGELQQCIPVANQKITEEVKPDGAAKIWFQWYWWGYKECYSELSAEYMLDVLQASKVTYAVYAWAKYYYYHYGQFCVNHSWVPPAIWITAS